MFQQPEIQYMWVIKFNYSPDDHTHPRARFCTPLEMMDQSRETLLDHNAIKSLEHIQSKCEKLRDECLTQQAEATSKIDDRMFSVEENIRSLEKLLEMYSDFIKRYPPFNEPTPEEE